MNHACRVLLILLCAAMPAWAGWQLDTNHPQLNMYEQGDVAQLLIHWDGDNAPSTTPGFARYDMLGNKLADIPAIALVDGKAVINLPTSKLGYFEIRALGKDADQIIPALGSRPAGMMTYGVVAKINPDPAHNWTFRFLGMQGTTILGNGHPLGWDAYPYLGIQTAGLGYHWNTYEPKGPEDFQKRLANDPYPQVIREMNIYPNFQVSGFPIWAVDINRLPENQRKGRGTTRLPPQDYAQYESFLRRIVAHIRDSYSQLPHRDYEILWEPCIPWGWYGSKDEIVKVFEVAHRVIHEVDPRGRVAGPTLSGLNDTGYLNELMDAGLGKYIDVLSCHPYKGYPPEKTAIAQGLAEVDHVVKNHVGKSLPFLGTEFGFTDEVCGGVLNHSYGITTSLIIFKASGAATHTIFYLADYAGEPGYGFFYNLVKGQPFGPRKISPKPAIPMIRACIDQIGTANVVGKLDYLGSDFWGYIFEDQLTHELFAAIWDASDKDRTLVFDTGMPRVNMVDGMGNPQTVTTRDGLLDLKLSRMPVYIRGISAEMYGPNRLKPLLDTAAQWTTARAKTLDVPMAFTRELTDKPVTLTFDTDASISDQQFRQTFTMQVGKSVHVKLPITANAPLGPAVGYLRLTSEGKTIWKGIRHLQITPELQFGSVTANPQGGTWQITQSVQNVSDQTWQGTVTTQVDGRTINHRKLTLPAGKQIMLSCPVPSDVLSTHVHPVKSIFDSQLKTQLTAQGDVTCMMIQPVSSPMDWSKLRTVHLSVDEQNLWKNHPSTQVHGDDDLSAEMAYGYDAKFVYFQAIVHDDVQRCDTRPGTTWDQDSVQLGFDVLPGREINTNLLAEKNERTNSEWCIALTPRGPEMYVHLLPGGSTIQDHLIKPGPLWDLSIKREQGVTRYRLKIAWQMLDPKNQRKGKMLGVAASINDSDAPSKFNDRVALSLFDGIVHGKDPEQYGKAILESK